MVKGTTNKYTYKVTWKSVVPFKVWFTFSANWKEGIEITDKEKKVILAAGVQECENSSFLWVPCAEDLEDTNKGWRVEFKGIKVRKRVNYGESSSSGKPLTFASREVTGKIVYSGEFYTDYYDVMDDFDVNTVQDRVREAAEQASEYIYGWLDEDNTGLRIDKENGFKDLPGLDKIDNEGGWIAITGGTEYAHSGWGSWFAFPAENGELKAFVTREIKKVTVKG